MLLKLAGVRGQAWLWACCLAWLWLTTSHVAAASRAQLTYSGLPGRRPTEEAPWAPCDGERMKWSSAPARDGGGQRLCVDLQQFSLLDGRVPGNQLDAVGFQQLMGTDFVVHGACVRTTW